MAFEFFESMVGVEEKIWESVVQSGDVERIKELARYFEGSKALNMDHSPALKVMVSQDSESMLREALKVPALLCTSNILSAIQEIAQSPAEKMHLLPFFYSRENEILYTKMMKATASILCIAVDAGSDDLVRIVVQAAKSAGFGDPNQTKHYKLDGGVAILAAIQQGRSDLVHLMLSSGALEIRKKSDLDKILELVWTQNDVESFAALVGANPGVHAFGWAGHKPLLYDAVVKDPTMSKMIQAEEKNLNNLHHSEVPRGDSFGKKFPLLEAQQSKLVEILQSPGTSEVTELLEMVRSDTLRAAVSERFNALFIFKIAVENEHAAELVPYVLAAMPSSMHRDRAFLRATLKAQSPEVVVTQVVKAFGYNSKDIASTLRYAVLEGRPPDIIHALIHNLAYDELLADKMIMHRMFVNIHHDLASDSDNDYDSLSSEESADGDTTYESRIGALKAIVRAIGPDSVFAETKIDEKYRISAATDLFSVRKDVFFYYQHERTTTNSDARAFDRTLNKWNGTFDDGDLVGCHVGIPRQELRRLSIAFLKKALVVASGISVSNDRALDEIFHYSDSFVVTAFHRSQESLTFADPHGDYANEYDAGGGSGSGLRTIDELVRRNRKRQPETAEYKNSDKWKVGTRDDDDLDYTSGEGEDYGAGDAEDAKDVYEDAPPNKRMRTRAKRAKRKKRGKKRGGKHT